jgi:hypothetical protein
MQKKQQKMSDNAALAGEALGDLTKSISTQESAIDAVNSSMLDYQLKLSNMEPAERKKWEASKAAREQLAAIGDAAKKAGIKLDGLKGIDLGKELVAKLQGGLDGVKTIVTNGKVTIMVGDKEFDIGKGGDGSFSNPFKGGTAAVALGNNMLGSPKTKTITEYDWDNAIINSPRGQVKDYAKQQDFKKGTNFTLENADGSIAQFKVVDDKFNVQLQKITPAEKKAMGGYIPGYAEGSGGTVRGAGTSTSDSIPAMLSNGEYVVRASAVSQYGVPFFDKVNAQKFAGGGMASNKSLMQPGDKWDNRGTTQSIGKFLLGNIGPQAPLMNSMPAGIKDKITSALWSMFGKPFEEIAAGSPTKGDWANAALSLVPGGAAAGLPKASLGLKNIKDAKAWTHYAHQPATEVFPSIGRRSNAMSNYGIGTYGSNLDIFKGAQFGEEAHKLSLSPLALIKTALGKGAITDAGIVKEAAAFNKATGTKISGSSIDLNNEDFVRFLSNRGYSGYKVDDVITNWKIGSGGVGLKNSLGKLPFGKQPGPISYPELPDMPGILFAQGGYVPKFESGINNVPADMLAQLHKNEAVIPANMNPFNPNANNATMGGATINITNNINGFDGDINQLSRLVTQQTVTAIKSMDSRAASTLGPKMNVGIN